MKKVAHHLTKDEISQRIFALPKFCEVEEETTNLKEIKAEFGDCDWMRAFLNGHTVDAVLWWVIRVEELEQHTKEDKGDKTMSAENLGGNQTREGQVTQELGKAENAAARLATRIDELETQLSMVLHKTEPPPPSASKEAQGVEATIVPLAHRIRDHYRFLQKQGIRLSEMLDRLEIR